MGIAVEVVGHNVGLEQDRFFEGDSDNDNANSYKDIIQIVFNLQLGVKRHKELTLSVIV